MDSAETDSVTPVADLKHASDPLASSTPNVQLWHQYVWMGAGVALFLVLILLLAFIGMTVASVMEIISSQQDADLSFVFSGVVLVNLTLLRLIALLIGAAIAFAGLAVSFYAHEKATSMSAKGRITEEASTGIVLRSFSPGIVGVIVGAVIIMTAILSTATHQYLPPTVTFEYQSAGNDAGKK